MEQIPEKIYKNETTEEGVRFVCENSNGDLIGSVKLTSVETDRVEVSGLFVNPSNRESGVATELIRMVNTYLDVNKKSGHLVNTIQGAASSIYEKNGWKKGEYVSQGDRGGYEYTYN